MGCSASPAAFLFLSELGGRHEKESEGGGEGESARGGEDAHEKDAEHGDVIAASVKNDKPTNIRPRHQQPDRLLPWLLRWQVPLCCVRSPCYGPVLILGLDPVEGEG